KLHIQPQRLFFEVEKAEAAFPRADKLMIAEIGVSRGSCEDVLFVEEHDRSDVSDARIDVKDPLFRLGVHEALAYAIRSWADEAHVTGKNVKKLGQLIELSAPYDMPDARNASVIGRSGINAALLSARHHRADFELAVRLPTPSDARTGKEGRVPIFEPNSERKRKA